jgi:tight adherence protein B
VRIVLRYFAAASAVAVLAVAMSGTAHADDGQIVQVVAADGKVQVVFGAPGLADGESLDPSTAKLRVGDQPLRSTGELFGKSGPSQVNRVSLLVLDTSGSMRGEPLDAAKAAAEQFLTSVPDDVQVGLITFADRATLRLAPIKNRDAVRSVVDALPADGATALYDGLNMAVSQLAGPEYSDTVKNVVLLTDGKDEGSTAGLGTVLGELEKSGITVDAVAFHTTAARPVLQEIVDAGRGKLVKADDADALSAAFTDSAKAISNQVLITAALPAGMEPGDPTVTVEVSATGGATFTDAAVMLLTADDLPAEQPRVEPAPVGGGGWTSSERTLQIALALVFLGAVVILGFMAAAFAGGRRESIMRERLAPYTLRGSGAHRPLPPPPSASGSEVAIARAAVGLAERVVAHKDFEARLASHLEAAAIPMKPAEWLLLHTGIALGIPLLLLLVSWGDVPLVLVGLLIGAVGPYVYLSVKQSKRKQKFEESLAPTLQLLAGSLAAGHSLPQAVDTVAQEASEPMASELRRAVAETRLAVTVEDALDHIAERTGSKDFAWVAMAVRIQRNVGGNLAELLTTVAATLRERERLRRHVRVLSAEGRLSAIILGALPILFAFYLFVVRRDYLMKLFTDPLGVAMVIVGSVIFVGSILVMVKLVKVEV